MALTRTQRLNASRVRRLCPWLARGAACVILAATLWQTGWLLADVVRYYASETIWLHLQVKLPVYLLCLVGSIALLRGGASAYKTIYAAGLLVLAGAAINWMPDDWFWWFAERIHIDWQIANYPFLAQRIPTAFPDAIAFWTAYGTAIGALLAGHLASRSSGRSLRWCQFRLASAFFFVPIAGLLLSAPISAQRLCIAAGTALGHAGEVEDHDPGKALEIYGTIVRRYPFTPAWDDAVVSSGLIYVNRDEERKAIARLERLFSSRAPVQRDLFHLLLAGPYNYNTACEALSTCYERLGDYPRALEYALLARDKYPRIYWCGTAAVGELQEQKQRIEHLRELAENSATRTERSGHDAKVETQLSAR